MWIPISEAPIACFPHFEVAAESGDWIVVDKGAPLIVHPSNGKKEPCLLEGVEPPFPWSTDWTGKPAV